MTDAKPPDRGTFTQLQDVLLMTCDLPDEAVVMFARLYCLTKFKEFTYIGSIRKMANELNIGRDKAHRNQKILEDAGLITIYDVEGTNVSVLKLNVEMLWELNRVYSSGVTIPRWNKLQDSIECVRKIGQSVLDIGQSVANIGQKVLDIGQCVRRSEHKVTPKIIKNKEIDKIIERGDGAIAHHAPPASSSLHWNESLTDISPMDVENMFEDVDISDAPTIHRMPAISSKEKGQSNAIGTLEHSSHLRNAQPDDTGAGLHRGDPLDAPQSARDGGVDAQSTHHAGAMAAADPAVHGTLSSAHVRDVDDHEIDISPAQHGKDAEMAAPLPRDATTSPVASQVPPASGNKRRGGSRKAESVPEPTLEESMTPDELAFYHEWCSLFRVSVPLTPAIAKSAKALASPLSTWAGILKVERAEVLKQMKGWEFQCNNSNGYFSKRGVKLYDLERDFEAWQSAMQQQIDGPEDVPLPAPVIGRQTFYEKLPEPDAEWLAAYYARQNGHAAGRPLN